MSGRRASRQLALQVLYYLDAADESVDQALDYFERLFDPAAGAMDFARELVTGVWARRDEVDRHIEAVSENWRLSRMSRVDRNVLRIGVYELLFADQIPEKVAINEAVELAKVFGADESRAFVNGILDAVRQAKHARAKAKRPE